MKVKIEHDGAIPGFAKVLSGIKTTEHDAFRNSDHA